MGNEAVNVCIVDGLLGVPSSPRRVRAHRIAVSRQVWCAIVCFANLAHPTVGKIDSLVGPTDSMQVRR